MLRFARRLSEEHGQSLLLLVLAMTVMLVVGAIVVDVGLWLSERRGSQTDADFAALAGAYELLNPGASSSDAVTAAGSSLTANNQQGNASFADPVVVDNSCFNTSKNDAVSVDVKHDSRALFTSIFGIVSPDIGAHAKACVGAAEAPGNTVPFEITDASPCFDQSSGKPIFTTMCWIAGGAQAPNDRGILDLNAAPQCSQNPLPADIVSLIENGAPGTCLINTTGSCNPVHNGPWYDCVVPQSGNPNNSDILRGTNARVSKDGLCDQNAPNSNHNGIDDFEETVVKVFDTGDPLTSIYAPRDCDPNTPGLQMSPRLVTIIVLAANPGSNNVGAPIQAFAGMYIAGCADYRISNPTQFDPYCGKQLVQQLNPAANGGDLYVSAVAPGPALDPCGQNNNQPTCTPTPTPTPSPTRSPTPTPSPTPLPPPSPTPGPTPTPGGQCGDPGNCAVYGRIVKIIYAGAPVGPPTSQTTLFGIALKE
jgi:Putative Flp pilus-assembly TadE/G-like